MAKFWPISEFIGLPFLKKLPYMLNVGQEKRRHTCPIFPKLIGKNFHGQERIQAGFWSESDAEGFPFFFLKQGTRLVRVNQLNRALFVSKVSP